MPFTLTMPKLSPTMEEGTIVKWHKKEGDHVKEGEVLFEVATDKATVEHSAIDEGYLRKILIGENTAARVNQAVAIFTEKKEESIEGYQPEGIEVKKEAAPAPAEKAEAKAAAPAAEKAAAAPAVSIGRPAFVPEPPLEGYEFQFPTEEIEGRISASPLARKLAHDKGIDITTVKGSGPKGRVVSRDLDLAQPDRAVGFARRTLPSVAPGSFEEKALSPMRKVIGQRLQDSMMFIPHFYVFQEIDAHAMVRTKEELQNMGVKVSYNDFVVRAVALSLREHPNVNAGFDSEKNAIIYFKTIDISIAVSMEDGLITPIVRHADYKNLGELSLEIKNLAAKARAKKLMPQEYKGGSFTISNLGMHGVSSFTAIINPPQAAILAIGGIEEKAVVRNGEVVAGKTMTLALSSDHRVLDGMDAAKFIKTVQKYLENPSSLLI
jgi:pyruvate dehydrogenase E2 component (dihydrolipoyllysine-residue acetyltransferase)